MASLACGHLVREFAGGLRALDDVSLEVDDGELVVLVGPSGCGKSTLLRIVAGLETFDSGTLAIGGRDVSALSPAERNVAMVFQDYALYPHMTVRRNLEFPLRVRGDAASERDAKVARVSAMLGLEALLARLPKELSGGQRQRVAMGRALVREPAISLLDEPLSNLDARLRSEVRAEIAELQQRTKTTMLYVTHDQVEAMTLGQRVAVLNKGVLQQVAPPAELYDRPANAFVAGFIGNPPMNILAVDVREGVATLRGSGAQIDLATMPRAGKDAALAASIGVRPEALGLEERTGCPGIDVVVEHVELLGHETLVHARLGTEQGSNEAARLVARLTGTRDFERGTPLRLFASPADLYTFAADGRTL